MTTLVRLTYFSRNLLRHRPAPTDATIDDILIASVANNRRDDVTGALVHDRNWFAQVLEGDEPTVSATFERVLHDPRHGDISLVTMQPIPARRFPFQWMAAVSWCRANADLFAHFCGERYFDPQLLTADRLNDLIEAVARNATEREGRQSWTTRSGTSVA